MNRAIFIDRDGVINKIHYDPDIGLCTPHTVDEFQFLPYVEQAIRAINEMGYRAILVCNQPDLSKGRLTQETHERINEKMTRGLEEEGARLDGIYYCTHRHEDGCECRKPKPGMLLQAAEDHDIDLSNSYIIADTLPDIQAGKAAGCKTILIGNPRCDLCKVIHDYDCEPDHIVKDLTEAVKVIQSGIGG